MDIFMPGALRMTHLHLAPWLHCSGYDWMCHTVVHAVVPDASVQRCTSNSCIMSLL